MNHKLNLWSLTVLAIAAHIGNCKLMEKTDLIVVSKYFDRVQTITWSTTLDKLGLL